MRERLGSRLGFVLLAAGCAVGLGNVWRFPYIVGSNGGAAFVLLYLGCLLILGFPLLCVELVIGRSGRAGISKAMVVLASRERSKFWHCVGWCVFLGNALLMAYYTTVSGWLLHYCLGYAGGRIGVEAEAVFNGVLSSPRTCIFMMLASVVLASGVCAAGLQRGVERVVKWMMFALFVLLGVLAARSCFLAGAAKGLSFYLKPDFGTIAAHPWRAVFCALGQAFFTLSVGVGCMTIFGSYVGKDRTLGSESAIIILLDTVVALLSGAIIFPACYTYGVDAGQGPGLIFIALPKVFANMHWGRLWGGIFFLFLSLAAVTTLVAVFECLIAGLMEERQWSRRKSSLTVAILVAIFSIPCSTGFNILSKVKPFGEGSTIMDFLDYVFSQFWLPLGALAMALFVTSESGMGWLRFAGELNEGKGIRLPTGRAMRLYIRIFVPILIVSILLAGLFSGRSAG